VVARVSPKQVSGMLILKLLFSWGPDVRCGRQSELRTGMRGTRQAHLRDREAQLIPCFSRVSSDQV
jgi:hypothetical protein